MVNGSSDGKMAQASFLKEYTWVMAQTVLQEFLFVDGWVGGKFTYVCYACTSGAGKPHTLMTSGGGNLTR